MKPQADMDINLDELAKEIKKNTAQSFKSLYLRFDGNVVFVTGVATSYYAKQVAIHVIKNHGLEVEDDIIVRWPNDPID